MFQKIQEKNFPGLIIFIMYHYYLTKHNGEKKSRSTTLELNG